MARELAWNVRAQSSLEKMNLCQYSGLTRFSNYVFGADADNKLSYIRRNFREQDESRYLNSLRTRYAGHRSQMNTNAAYSLARRWLTAAAVDVSALEHDCKAHIRAWNSAGQFVPLYEISWADMKQKTMAVVELIEPERNLEELWVFNGNYIQRKPLAVSNREKLLQTADDN